MLAEQLHTEQMHTDHTHLRIELWMREYSPHISDRQQAIFTQVQDLAENDFIDTFEVNTWGTYIATATTGFPDGTATTALDTVREFEEWADQNGCTLQPSFQRREQPSLASDTYEVIVPPILCLAVYEDETLRAVSPCSGPNRHRTITDHLESLTTNNNS